MLKTLPDKIPVAHSRRPDSLSHDINVERTANAVQNVRDFARGIAPPDTQAAQTVNL